jgi:hypothetical protein
MRRRDFIAGPAAPLWLMVATRNTPLQRRIAFPSGNPTTSCRNAVERMAGIFAELHPVTSRKI